MTLSPGARLGPYEITAKLGQGGMGEVYRASDAKLKRDVAIKVLPAGFTQDEERLARFEREAQLLAQLHHPHIASIFGLEETDGTSALVMELVEGPTLAERMGGQPPIPIEEALEISLQIAEALETAHEKGIIHRDLKPQNVKLTPDGEVKVLDFGLAKAMDPAGSSSGADSPTQLAASPTLTLGATVQGVILGTAAYMAPEQAAGKGADRRSDVWSFGVVLYEMLTGSRLFEGESVSHVLAGVLKDEPDFSRLPEETPPRVRRLVRRCLRKKPRERLQAIGDARLVIEEVLSGADPEEATAAATDQAPRSSRWTLPAAAAVLALLLGLAAGSQLLAPRVEPPPPTRLELDVGDAWALNVGQGHPAVALSPDGRRVVLAVTGEDGRSGLLLRDLSELEPRLLPGTEGARAPFFSPDGEWIAYATPTELFKVSAVGGQPLRLTGVDGRWRGGVWAPDGFIYFTRGTVDPVLRVSEAGTLVEPVTQLDNDRRERTHRWPALSPDGAWLLYTSDTVDSPTDYDDARIEALHLESGRKHVMIEGASRAQMPAEDLLIYANAANLFAQALDPKTLLPRGRPILLEQDVSRMGTSGAVQFMAQPGAAVWLTGKDLTASSSPAWHSREGEVSPSSVPSTQVIDQLELSPDGRFAAVRGGANLATTGSTPDAVDADLWVADLERGLLTRLTFGENASVPTWSPDGKRIAYRRASAQSNAGSEAQWEMVLKPADGSAEAEVLYRGSGNLEPNAFSPDGRYLVYENVGDLWLLPLDPPGEPVPFQPLTSGSEEWGAVVSPDGRWIAYQSDENERMEVYVRPFPEGAGKWQVSTDTGFEPRWSADGQELFYRTAEGAFYSVPIEIGTAFRPGAPQELFLGLRGDPDYRSYGVTPDGQRILSLVSFVTGLELDAVNYSSEWVSRARRLLGQQR